MCESSNSHEEFTEQNGEFDLPQHILEKYDSCQQVQLIKGYRILQVLKYYSDNKPFFEKPKNENRGSVYYYDVIKTPMWLNEIKRKFFNAEYNSLCDVIADMRLIFENCYYFWGPKSLMTELCLQMERLLENQMILLPRDMKNACTLEETQGKNEDDIVTKVWNRCRNKGKNCSRLMLRAWRRRRIAESKEYDLKSDLSTFCKNSKQILKWEKDVLSLFNTLSSIYSSSELPQIALFIHLVQNSFNLTSVLQTQIERMMLMPQHSDSFQEIMSALLSDNQCKVKLKYEELMKEFQKCVSNWYSDYENNDHDALKVSQNTGIEENFFEIVGDNNVLLTQKYEELPYNQKTKILKSVCDHLAYTRDDIKEIIINADEKEFSPQKIGRDKHGYTYLFFPSFLDFRLYKQKIMDKPHLNKEGINETNLNLDHHETPLRRFFPPNSTPLELVADSVEGLRCLIDELFYSDIENTKKDAKFSNTEIIDGLQELLERVNSNEDEYIRVVNETRIKLFNEWRTNSESGEPIVDDEISDDELNDENESDGNPNLESELIEKHHENTKESEVDEKRDHESETEDENDCADDKDEDDKNKESEEEAKSSQPDEEIRINNKETKIESFTEEMESFIKTEPRVVEEKYEESGENYSDFYLKDAIKEESKNDSPTKESTVNTRRRRSSVPSYNVFNEDFFSDENESFSPEEVYSSEEDSDDEWEIPKKRTRNRNKMRISKQFKVTLKNETSFGDRRKRRCTSAIESNPNSDSSSGTRPQIKELKIKVEDVKSESMENFDKVDDDTIQKDDEKPPLKIKVIDLAKLKNNEIQQNLANINKSNPNAFMIQSRPSVCSLPIIGPCMSAQDMTAYSTMQRRVMVRQPLVGNVYMNKSQNSTRRIISSQNIALNRSPQTIIRTPGVVTGFPNAPNLMVYRRAVGSKQMTRAPIGVMNKFMGNEVMRKQPITYERGVRNNVPLPKIGKNITVIPKVINKPIQRRPSVREIEGTIGIHANGGLMQYVVNLANGTRVPLSDEQVQKLREGNRGILPQKLKIPVPADVAEKIEPCVVIDD